MEDGQFREGTLTDGTVEEGTGKKIQCKTFCRKRDKHIVNKCDSKLKREWSGSLT